jgi:uncharacterized membrane protein
MTIFVDGVAIPDSRLLPPVRRRIWELDFLRGICVLLMILDHTLFDIWYIFGDNWVSAGGAAKTIAVLCQQYYYWELRYWVQDIVLWIFCTLTGMSVAFSRNNPIRIFKIAACAVVITAATTTLEALVFGGEGFAVRFGVLHMLAVCAAFGALVYAAFPDRPYVRTAVAWGLAFGLYLVNWLVIRPTAYPTTPVWNCILSEKMGDMYAFTPGDGFPILGSNVYLADKYPSVCFPYLSRVLFGVGLVGLLYPAKRSLLPRLDRGWQRPVSFVGRHTLWVVVIHQVIIAALLALITGWFVTPGNYGF